MGKNSDGKTKRIKTVNGNKKLRNNTIIKKLEIYIIFKIV